MTGMLVFSRQRNVPDVHVGWLLGRVCKAESSTKNADLCLSFSQCCQCLIALLPRLCEQDRIIIVNFRCANCHTCNGVLRRCLTTAQVTVYRLTSNELDQTPETENNEQTYKLSFSASEYDFQNKGNHDNG